MHFSQRCRNIIVLYKGFWSCVLLLGELTFQFVRSNLTSFGALKFVFNLMSAATLSQSAVADMEHILFRLKSNCSEIPVIKDFINLIHKTPGP